MTEIRQKYLCFVMGLLCDFGTFSPLPVVDLYPVFSSRGRCEANPPPPPLIAYGVGVSVKLVSLTYPYLFAKAFFCA